MSSFIDDWMDAWRDWNVDNLPASLPYKPAKPVLRALGAKLNALLSQSGLGAQVEDFYATQTLLNADLAHAADTVALVYADPADAKNDYYVKVGASGSGSWSPLGILTGASQMAALAADVSAIEARTVAGGGLVTGGGDLSASRTLTVTKASQEEVTAGTNDAKAVTPLAAAVLAKKTTTINAGGIASGGGDLSGNRTITVTKASSAEVIAGTNDTHAMTPASAAPSFNDGFARTAAVRAQSKRNRINDLPAIAPNAWGSGVARVIDNRYVFEIPVNPPVPAVREYAVTDTLIAHSAAPVMETWTWQGSITAARFTDGVYTQPQRLMYPVAATHMVKSRPQLAAQCAWSNSQTGLAPRWPVIFSGTQASDSCGMEPIGGDLHAFQSITGQLSVTRIPSGALPLTTNSDKLIIYQVQGQSLGTNRVGPGAFGAETWSIKQEWGAALTSRILSWSAIQAAELDYSGEAFQNAIDELNGAPAATDGGYVMGESPFMAAAIVQTLTATGATTGQKLHVSTVAVGGMSIEYFMSAADGGDGDHWDNVFMPSLDRFASQATANSLTISEFRAPWIQGETNHVTGDSVATYRAKLDTFIASSDTEIHSRIGSGVIIRHASYQMGRIYAASDVIPTGSAENQISQVALAQGEKAISNEAADASYSAWPIYGLEFSGVSHMTERGYHWLHSMLGHICNDWNALSGKLKPLHIIPGAERWANAGKQLILPLHTPHNQRAKIYVPPSPSPLTGIPKKPDYGLDFTGGDSVPARSSITLSEDGMSIIIDFAAAWTGAARKVGMARVSPGSHQQGWFSITFNPGGAWVHTGVGSNIYCDTHWTDVRTGAPLRAYPIHQQIILAD